MTRKRIDWVALESDILRAVDELEKHGFVEPTIRAVYYVMSDTYGLIPGTPYGYKQLDAKIVELRRRGDIPWGFFAVKRGTSRTCTAFISPQKEADYWVDGLKDAHEDYSIPRWRHQKTYVEVWVEKDGLLGATRSFIDDLDVTVRAPQGYGAWEFVRESMINIGSRLEDRPNVERVLILYLGDLDPSGKDIPRFLRDDPFDEFAGELNADVEIDFEELGLEVGQVRSLGLPESPESPETLRKIENDPRYRWFVQRYGTVFCELDSLYALRTEEARRLVRDAVLAVWNPNLYAETQDEEREGRETVHDLIRDRVEFEEDEE